MKIHNVPMRLALDPIALALAQCAHAGAAALLMLAVGAWFSPARAERADRDQPTNVESDRLYYDDGKQTTGVHRPRRADEGADPQRPHGAAATDEPANGDGARKAGDIPTEARRSR